MADFFSPTGYAAHFGRRYRVGDEVEVIHELRLPVVRFDDDDDALVCAPKGRLVHVGHADLKRDGLVFMRVTSVDVDPLHVKPVSR